MMYKMLEIIRRINAAYTDGTMPDDAWHQMSAVITNSFRRGEITAAETESLREYNKETYELMMTEL